MLKFSSVDTFFLLCKTLTQEVTIFNFHWRLMPLLKCSPHYASTKMKELSTLWSIQLGIAILLCFVHSLVTGNGKFCLLPFHSVPNHTDPDFNITPNDAHFSAFFFLLDILPAFKYHCLSMLVCSWCTGIIHTKRTSIPTLMSGMCQ